ncbi:MAG: ATP-binding protein [Terriglobia bacterium]
MALDRLSEFRKLLEPYNPWWTGADATPLPIFRRPIFDTLRHDLERVPQILSITGPRRIGKTTLLRQLIHELLGSGIAPENLVYYSCDDPALLRYRGTVGELIEMGMRALRRREKTTYLFLDEIQRLEGWELFLKKYYDLKYPVRFLISGSASSPIFKKSRESLLGRVKDYHLLPFSFREFLLYQLRDEHSILEELRKLRTAGEQLQGMVAEAPIVDAEKVQLPAPSPELVNHLNTLLNRYMLEGGFPEVWELPDWKLKQEYLFDNQINKVIYEDLVLAVEFRKPELLKRFYISLLERPGCETNVGRIAGETGINSQQIEKYWPLLEMTDLVYRIERFRKSPTRVRRGLMKFYLVDLALRNAVLRIAEMPGDDPSLVGRYAENLVFLALKKWPGTIQLDYFRERDDEVDFIVHVGPRTYLPVEVKYQEQIKASDFRGVESFHRRVRPTWLPIAVTKKWEDFGGRGSVFQIPLPLFLLFFD